MSDSQPEHVVFQCDDAPLQVPESMQLVMRILRIRSEGSAAEIDLQLHHLHRIVVDAVNDRHADLVRIAAFVYRADMAVSRGSDKDTDARYWRRRLHLCIPVTDPAFWNQHEVLSTMSAALGFLTDDTWSFTFSPAPADRRPIQTHMLPRDPYHQPGVVTLFSGGLDSLCTLVESSLNGERPVALGHWASSRNRHRQESLLKQLNYHHRSWTLPLLGAEISRRGTEPEDNTQRSRGFLYGCLASAVAAEIGAPRVYLSDNGPISLNLPINDQLVGAMSSRATHPQFLDRLNQFIRLVTSSAVAVSNPLQWKTRTEALDILKIAGVESLVVTTLSCSAGSRLTNATPHCGGCSQCVDRRVATIAAGLEVHDPASRYHQDLFLDVLEPWDRAMTAYSYVRFARSVSKQSDTELLERYPQLLDLVTPSDSSPGQTIRDAIDLIQRHVETVMRVMSDQLKIHVDRVVAGDIPAGSLLGKVIGEQVGRRAPQATLRVVTEHDVQTASIVLVPPTSPSQPTMVWNENAWNITYGSRTVSIGRSVNIARLAALLREPGRQFSPEDVVAITEGRTIDHGENRGGDEALQTLSLGSDQPVMDRRAIQSVRSKMRDLRNQAARLRQAGDEDLAAETEAQIETIERYLKQVTGLHGRPRSFATENQQRYRTIRRSVERAIETIGHHHRPLWDHLSQTIHLDQSFIYSPEPVVFWKVVLPSKAA